MAGRASRSQGVQRCAVYLVEKKKHGMSKQNVKTILVAREPVPESTCRPQMVRCVLRCTSDNVANPDERKVIWNFFKQRIRTANFG